MDMVDPDKRQRDINRVPFHFLDPSSIAGRIIIVGLIVGMLAVVIVGLCVTAFYDRDYAILSAKADADRLVRIILHDERPSNGFTLLDREPAWKEQARYSLHGQNTIQSAFKGTDITRIDILQRGGDLHEHYFRTNPDLGINELVSRWSEALARQDSEAIFIVTKGNGETRYIAHPDYWQDRLGEVLYVLTILVTILGAGAIFVSWCWSETRVFRKLARKDSDLDRWMMKNRSVNEARDIFGHMETERQSRKDAIAERTRMLTAISHDLRTPATRLRLRAEFIDDDGLRGKILGDLETMLTMTGDAIDFLKGAMVEEAMEKLDFTSLIQAICDDFVDVGQPVTFREPLKESVNISGHLFGASHINQSVSTEDLLKGHILGRPKALQRAFTNLIANGVKYGRQVDVHLRIGALDMRVDIIDRGPGIPEDEMENVLKPFYRLEKSRNRDTGGSGLGLSIAKTVFDAHQADLHLMNEPRGGLRIRVIIPRMPQETSLKKKEV